MNRSYKENRARDCNQSQSVEDTSYQLERPLFYISEGCVEEIPLPQIDNSQLVNLAAKGS